MSGDGRVDLKQCKVAVKNKVERVKGSGLGGATGIVRSLEGAYDRLTASIDHRERVSGDFSNVWTGLISFARPVATTILLARRSSYRTGLPATADNHLNRPLSVRMFFSFSRVSLSTSCVPVMLYHLILRIATYLILNPVS